MGFRTGKKERLCLKGAAGSGKCQEEPGVAGWDWQSPTPHDFIHWGLLFQAVQYHTLVRSLKDGADMLPDGSLKHGKATGHTGKAEALELLPLTEEGLEAPRWVCVLGNHHEGACSHHSTKGHAPDRYCQG